LIADDERIIREGIVSTVDWKRLGVSRVLQAADGHEAYERIRRDRPDIAIVDIIMPGLSGIEIITRFQGDRRAPEFVILSAHDEFNYAREAIRCSVNDYLLKPCGRGDIEAAIRRVIARLKERRSLDAERAELR